MSRENEAQVTVYCDASSHATRRALLRTFARVADPWQGRAGRWVLKRDTAGRQLLGGDTAVDLPLADDVLADGLPGPARLRWLLECKLCGENLPIRDGELLNGVFDVLAAAGRSHISLAGLRARMC